MLALNYLINSGRLTKVEFIKDMYNKGKINTSHLDVQETKGLISITEKNEILGL